MNYARLPFESFTKGWPLSGIEVLAKKRSPLAARHPGLDGKPCQCTPYSLRRATRGLSRKCFHRLFPSDQCKGVAHARCPDAKPCIGGCGRLTTSGESTSPGYCKHCSADRRWVKVA